VSLQRRALLAALPPVFAALPLSCSCAAAAAAVDSAALAHCAAITAADERLACYDSLARPKPRTTAAANSTPASGKASPHAAAAPPASPTAAAAATAAPAAAAAGVTAAGATGDSAKSFGLTKHPAPAAEEVPDHIQAQVTRMDTDRLGNVRLSLDNGQVWTFNAQDTLIRVGDAVTIKRGALGSFLLRTPEHHTYKVQRSQ
jgi:hypothetical protein